MIYDRYSTEFDQDDDEAEQRDIQALAFALIRLHTGEPDRDAESYDYAPLTA